MSPATKICSATPWFWLLAVLALAGGCARERPVELARRDGMLLLGNGPEPQALDPHVTTGTPELNIQMALFEGLVGPHPETLEPLPAAAESWSVSADGLRYVFTIRDSARWSDGAPVTARDFVAGWRRALSPAQAAPNAVLLHVIAGAAAFNRGETADFAGVGVRALDERRLEVTLAGPAPHFLSLLLHPVWYPVPSHRLGEGTAAGDRAGPWTRPESFVGNGPFVLSAWRPRQYVEARRNPLYWDAAAVRLQAVRFHAIDEPAAEERAFLSGQLHVTDALPPARVAAYRRAGSPPLRIDPYLGTYYILPNLRSGPLADPRVRRALSLAVDRAAVTERLLGAGQAPAGGFVPPAMPGYDAGIAPVHDPAAARALLAEAGFPGGRGLPRLEYLFNTSESHRQIAEALQAMWRRELGVDVQLVNMEWRSYLDRRTSGEFQLARAVWIGDYLEPSTFLDLWTSGNPNNWAGWSDPAYDALMAAARAAPDPAERMRLYAAAERRLIEQQVIIPLYHYVTVYLIDPAVRGWHANLLDWHPLKHVWLE